MLSTLEAKLWAALLGAGILFLIGALFTQHLLDAGKAEEKAAVLAQMDADQRKADAETAGWKGQLLDAKTARVKELQDAQDLALKPYSISVQRYAISPSVPAGSAATGGGAGATAVPVVCNGVLQESPEQLRADFAEAQRADQLAADYRDLYASWPTIKSPN